MKLAAYTELIKRLPFEDHSFVTQRTTWEPFKGRGQFTQFYKDTFFNKEAVTLSRRDILSLAKRNSTKAIFSIILWGYPRGYTRPNNMARSFPLFLKQVGYLSERLSGQSHIKAEELEVLLKKCDGIGLSTLSKLLYFFNIKLENNRCLIMDKRIVDVLSKDSFTEFGKLSTIRDHSKVGHYADYLRTCAQLSKKHGYKPDQLEMFLFLLGKNLKATSRE